MKKKNVLVILLTVLVFLSGTVLGVANVYRIDAVYVAATLVSKEAKTETEDLQERLKVAYDKSSILFAKRDIAERVVADFPYFRITGFKKAYPDRIVVEVTEDAETYAVSTGDTSGEYYILNSEGTVLGVRADYRNRADDYDNVLLSGVTVSGEKGGPIGGDDSLSVLFAFCGETSARLEGIRRNVTQAEVLRPTSETAEMMFCLHMREGVKIYVSDPESETSEKAQSAVDKYMGISSAQRLTGMIVVSEKSEGVVAEYFHDEWTIS